MKLNFWAKIGIAVIATGSLVGLLVWESSYTKKQEEEKALVSKAFKFDAGEVRSVSLNTGENHFEFTRSSATVDWEMTQPKQTKADQDAVNNFVSALQNIRVEQEVTGSVSTSNPEELTAYGLDKPRHKVILRLEKGIPLEFNLGADLKIGNESGGKFMAVSTYASATGKEKILVVDSSVDSTLTKTFADFRSKVVGDFKFADVQKLTLSQLGAKPIVVAKVENDWRIMAPLNLPADSTSISAYLEKMSRLRANKVYEADEKLPADVNLANPNATLTVSDGEKELQTIKLSLTKNQIYVNMPDGTVGTLDLANYADHAPTLKNFRDRRFMRGLTMSEITQIKTKSGKVYQKDGANWYFLGDTPEATAEGLASKPTNKDAADLFSDLEFMNAVDIIDGGVENLSKFGFTKPVTSFELIRGDKGSEQILIGNRVPKDEKSVYAKRSGLPEVFIVDSAWTNKLADLDKGPQAPAEEAKEPTAKK